MGPCCYCLNLPEEHCRFSIEEETEDRRRPKTERDSKEGEEDKRGENVAPPEPV